MKTNTSKSVVLEEKCVDGDERPERIQNFKGLGSTSVRFGRHEAEIRRVLVVLPVAGAPRIDVETRN